MELKQVSRQLRESKCIVTGGTGMIGREVVRLLCDVGANVVSVSLDKLEVDDRAEQVYGDLCNFDFCKEIVKGARYVLHVAGIKGSIVVTKSKPASFFVALLQMNTNVLEAARLNKVERLVYTSSIGAYPSAEVFVEGADICAGEPMDMFPGWAKRMAELQIKAYGIQFGMDNFAIVRPCNIYGPGDNFDPDNAMVIPSLMARIDAGENPLRIWGDGKAVRDFAYSTDVAEGTILALLKGTKGSYVNLASGKGYTIKELAEALRKALPVEFEYEFDTSRSGGFPRRVMDISLARELIGYQPRTTLEEGLRKTWDWFQEHREEYKLRKNYFTEA
jgi:GDP-L-fucose synthase